MVDHELRYVNVLVLRLVQVIEQLFLPVVVGCKLCNRDLALLDGFVRSSFERVFDPVIITPGQWRRGAEMMLLSRSFGQVEQNLQRRAVAAPGHEELIPTWHERYGIAVERR